MRRYAKLSHEGTIEQTSGCPCSYPNISYRESHEAEAIFTGDRVPTGYSIYDILAEEFLCSIKVVLIKRLDTAHVANDVGMLLSYHFLLLMKRLVCI